MPLSEEELRALEQMERALVEEDPKFASTLRGTSLRAGTRRRAVLGGVVFVVGVTVLMTGAITQLWYVGVVGFVLMLGSATLALSAMRGRQQPGSGPTPEQQSKANHPSGFSVIPGGRRNRRSGGSRGNGQGRSRSRSARSSGSFMERMEERWRRRRESGGW